MQDEIDMLMAARLKGAHHVVRIEAVIKIDDEAAIVMEFAGAK